MAIQAEQCSRVGHGLVLLRSKVIQVMLNTVEVSTANYNLCYEMSLLYCLGS
jgi:hypothetical protein